MQVGGVKWCRVPPPKISTDHQKSRGTMDLDLFGSDSDDSDSCAGDAASNCASILDNNEIDSDLMWFYILMLVILFAAFRLLAAIVLVMKSKRFY